MPFPRFRRLGFRASRPRQSHAQRPEIRAMMDRLALGNHPFPAHSLLYVIGRCMSSYFVLWGAVEAW